MERDHRDNPLFVSRYIAEDQGLELFNEQKDRYSAFIETICGAADDSQPVEQYDGTLGVTAAFVAANQSAVCQVQWNANLASIYTNPGDVSGVRWGTGTMISDDIMLTCGHLFDQSANGWSLPRQNGTNNVISPEEIATNMQVNFNFQVDAAGNPRPEQSFPILELIEYRLGGIDMALCRIGQSPGTIFGRNPVSPNDAAVAEMLCIIGHPAGMRKRVEVGPATSISGNLIHYNDIDTLGGNSGSGILRASDGRLVGIHTNGGCNSLSPGPFGGSNFGQRIAAVIAVSPTLQALTIPTGPVAQGDDMQPGEILGPGQSISSANGRYTLVYQTDGNLVLYRGGVALWASGTDGKPVGVCIMQADGNLVIYAPGGQPIWSSDTWQHPNSRLVVQDDGNVVIYRPDGTPVWSTNTWIPVGPIALGDEMQPGEVLGPDESIVSASGLYTFIYQSDGNLVLYRAGVPLWASGTDGKPVGVCIMQTDGNLVIYAHGGQPIWSSDTWQHPGNRLVIQDDGNVVIYRPDGTPVWATNTWVPTGPNAQGDDMQPGETLLPGQSITSTNGLYTFVYQGDGNLVLYRTGVPRWASGTDGRPTGVCIMQSDGNLVLYQPGGQPLWSSDTWQHPGSRLVAQDDGNVVIYRPDGMPVWATNTVHA